MKKTFKIYNGSRWTEYPIYNRATADLRLDEQLDTGGVMTIMESVEPIPPMSMAELIFSDNENRLSMPAYCFDTVEIRGQGYCVHNLTLVEPTRMLMGILIDGVKVTQPTNGDNKKSLYTVVQRLVNRYSLLKISESVTFTITSDSEIVSLLEKTESPEFTWEAETQLWECLKDIGNVINCIPRLEFNQAKTDFCVITFDRVNAVVEEREL